MEIIAYNGRLRSLDIVEISPYSVTVIHGCAVVVAELAASLFGKKDSLTW